MKIVSLTLLVSGSLLAVYGLHAMGELGGDLIQSFASGAGATEILPLAVGIVMVVVSIAGMLPGSVNTGHSRDRARDQCERP